MSTALTASAASRVAGTDTPSTSTTSLPQGSPVGRIRAPIRRSASVDSTTLKPIVMMLAATTALVRWKCRISTRSTSTATATVTARPSSTAPANGSPCTVCALAIT